MDPLDWVAIGAALVAFVFSFFAYFSYNATAAEANGECRNPSDVPDEARGLLNDLCGGTTVGAWHGFFGWFGVLLGLIAGGLVGVALFARSPNALMWTRRLAFGAAALAVVSTLLALAVVPDWPDLQSLAASVGVSYSRADYNANISNGHGFSYWIVLALLAALAAVTFLQFRRTESSAAAGVPPPATEGGYGPGSASGAPQGAPGGYRPTWQPPPPGPSAEGWNRPQ